MVKLRERTKSRGGICLSLEDGHAYPLPMRDLAHQLLRISPTHREAVLVRRHHHRRRFHLLLTNP